MSARFRARRQLVNRITARVSEWATREPDVRAALVVGSYAYGHPRMRSDLDLVILADNPGAHLDSLDFATETTPRGRLVRWEQWGPMHERRIRLPSGLLVEFGLTTPQWADVPVDPGTARVLTDGCRILYDEKLVVPALQSMNLTPQRWAPTR